jgi:ribosomal protein S18 acetylase RimI-like enzyme
MFFRCIILSLVTCSSATAADLSNVSNISATLLEKNIQETDQSWFSQFGTAQKTETYDFWVSPYKDHIVNGISRLGICDEKSFTRDISAITDYAMTHTVPFSWSINPVLITPNMSALLKAKGFSKETVTVMVHTLQNIATSEIPSLCVKPIGGNEVQSWLTVFNTVFGENDPAFTQAYCDVMHRDVSNNAAVEYYAGYSDAKIVSTGTVFLCSTYGLIANIATLPEHRNKGLATRVTTALLKRAREKGLKYAFLTTDNAAKLYAKMGFKKVMEMDNYIFNC